jgi:hypothetical protein
MVYQSSIQSHHNAKQWDILVIKFTDIHNYTSTYNLTMVKKPNQYVWANQMSHKTYSMIRIGWFALFYVWPLITPIMTIRFTMMIKTRGKAHYFSHWIVNTRSLRSQFENLCSLLGHSQMAHILTTLLPLHIIWQPNQHIDKQERQPNEHKWRCTNHATQISTFVVHT